MKKEKAFNFLDLEKKKVLVYPHRMNTRPCACAGKGVLPPALSFRSIFARSLSLLSIFAIALVPSVHGLSAIPSCVFSFAGASVDISSLRLTWVFLSSLSIFPHFFVLSFFLSSLY